MINSRVLRDVILLSAIFLAFAFGSCSKDPSGPESGPDIQVSSTSLSFTVAQGDTSSEILEVTNEGNSLLRVESVEDDASWVTVTPSSFELEEGESQEVLVVVKTASVEIGTHEASITIVSNDPDEEETIVEVTLVAGSGPDISISTVSLLIVVDPRASAADTLLVSNEGAATLRVMSINDTADWLSASPDSFDVAVGSSQEVVVTVDADSLNPGVYDATIVLESNDPAEPSIEVDVDLTVNPWQDGMVKWTFNAGHPMSGSPAIGSDGTIYVAGSQSGIGHIYALNSDGTLEWEFQADAYIHRTPSIGSDGTLYFGASDDCVYALNPDGTLRWRYYVDGEFIGGGASVADDQTIYVGTQLGPQSGALHAINSNGTFKWRYEVNGEIGGCPSVGLDGTVYFSSSGSSDHNLHALNPDGTLKWQFNGGWRSFRSPPALGSDGIIYVGSTDSQVYALNPDGTLKWTFDTDDDVWTCGSIGPDGSIYIGSDDEYLYAINPDGTLRWRYGTPEVIRSTPAIGIDWTIYVGSNDGRFRAIRPDGTLKWSLATGDAVYASPTIGFDGTVYVHSSDEWLYAIQSSSTGLATSPWPKDRGDLMNSGRYSGP